jgi:hypothetical protein
MHNYSVDTESGCWIWQGKPTATGCGQLKINGRVRPVHVWHYERANGPIPNGMIVQQTCCNRLCCNPEHRMLVSRSLFQRHQVAQQWQRQREDPAGRHIGPAPCTPAVKP